MGEETDRVARRSRCCILSHTPLSRWRLQAFRATLDGIEGNDEVEVTGEGLCDVILLVMGVLERY